MLDPVAYAPYDDPDHFIREVTDRIWVDRDIEHIEDNYQPDSLVHGSLGTVVGRDGVVAGSLMHMATAPDRVSQAEDVVWEPRGNDAFVSSHLVLGTDTAMTAQGVVSLRGRTIAVCLYRRGVMVEEWLVRDMLAQIEQRGLDPEFAASQTAFQGYAGSLAEAPPTDVLSCGDSGSRPDLFRAECELVLDFIDQVWNRRNLAKFRTFTPRDFVLQTIGDRTVLRAEGYQRDLLTMLAPFPEARFQVRDLATNFDPRYAGLRISVTWKLVGAYQGVAQFGPVTGTEVEVLGCSQFLVQDGRIVREMRVYDEIALRSQIRAAQIHVSPADPISIY